MDLDLIWKAIVVVLGGTFLLRIAGRKSISQMTLAQTVIMIGIGSLLVQPIAGEGVWTTLVVGGILVLTLIATEYAQIKSDGIESLVTGKSKVLIENGHLNERNLQKLRLTVDQLEMNLRQKNVKKISDVKWATLEPNGQVGYELKEEAQPVTKKEFQSLQQDIQQIRQILNSAVATQQIKQFLNTASVVQNPKQGQTGSQQDLFSEVDKGFHNNEPPKNLQ